MNRADERALAWALADAAAPYLPREARVRLSMKIGAGELDGAIVDLLTFYGHTETRISLELIAPLDVWIFGYRGPAADQRNPIQQATKTWLEVH
jgi:hypothetical protein